MLKISPINAFDDNYLWLFQDLASQSKQACIVDPGDADVVLKALKKEDLSLAAIFITHHHGDHTGGIARLLEVYDVPVYGPQSSNIPLVTHPLHNGDTVELFDQTFHILEIPGHTLDHIAYYTKNHASAEGPVLFCGDTLFAGGCGRVFEGTYEMMHHSLQKLAHLAPQTLVFCAHEYTMANLAFAAAVSPTDQELADRIKVEQTKRNENIPTVPTSIKVELGSNPFLRCDKDELIQSAQERSSSQLAKPEAVFASLRQWKDSF